VFNKIRQALSTLVSEISTKELSDKELEEPLWNLQLSLIESDVAVPVAEALSEAVKQRLLGLKVKRFGAKEEVAEAVKRAVREALLELLEKASPINLIEKVKEKRSKSKDPFVIVFVGVNGTGKTTTIAKIAKYLTNNGFTVLLACSDTFRAGALEQLEMHAKRVGVKVIKHRYGADPAAVAYDAIASARARGIDVVLVDTAGRMQTDRGLMDELRKIVRVSQPDLVVFVGDALAGNDALEQAKKFEEAVGIDAVVLTKVDADARGGAAVSIAHAIGKPIIFLGCGQRYEDLIPFTREWLVDRIMGGS